MARRERSKGRAGALALLLLVGALPVAAEPPRLADAVHLDAVPAGPSAAARIAEIRRRLQDALVYPERARQLGLTGVTRVRFEIDPRGAAQRVETAHSSGHVILDRAAEQAARDAAPLPGVYGRLEVPVHFVLEP